MSRFTSDLMVYADSLLVLQTQAYDLEHMLQTGQRRWAGRLAEVGLADTLKAMLADATKALALPMMLADNRSWVQAKYDWAHAGLQALASRYPHLVAAP